MCNINDLTTLAAKTGYPIGQRSNQSQRRRQYYGISDRLLKVDLLYNFTGAPPPAFAPTHHSPSPHSSPHRYPDMLSPTKQRSDFMASQQAENAHSKSVD